MQSRFIPHLGLISRGAAGLLLLALAIPEVQGVPKTITKSISAAQGGTISSPSGGLVLSIPAGALEKDTSISVNELPPGEGPVLGPSYQLLPEGLKFKKPAKLTLRFKPADVPAGYEKEDVAILEEHSQGPALQLAAGMGGPSGANLSTGASYLETEVNAAAGTLTSSIEHFSSYSARAYSSYALGSGKRELKGIYDFFFKLVNSQGSGYAEAQGSAKMGGEFFMKVGARMGVEGGAGGGVYFAKNFRVKPGRKGERSTTRGQIIVDIDHSLAITPNNYAITLSAAFFDMSGKPAGRASFPVQDLNRGMHIFGITASQLYYANPNVPSRIRVDRVHRQWGASVE